MSTILEEAIKRDTERLNRALANFQRAFRRWEPFSPENIKQHAAVEKARRELNIIGDRLDIETAVQKYFGFLWRQD